MCEEDNYFIRELELLKLTISEENCEKCLLKRSNAVRRKSRRPIVKITTNGNSARRRQKSLLQDRNLKNLPKPSGKTIKHFLQDKLIKMAYNKDIQTLLRKSRKIHPLLGQKIQQVDGGFFEKFGNLFRESTQIVENRENEEEKKVAEMAAIMRDGGNLENYDENANGAESDTEVKSLNSEGENEENKADLISAAFNIDELYGEILYEILHNVGCDVTVDIGQTALISYAQEAFKIPNNKHQQLLAEAEKKEAPEFLINVEVIEAKDLKPKDSNGLSDPFVTLYLASNQTHRYNTSVKYATLTPSWEEHFALPMNENSNDDTLCIEVWDFDAAESVKEKFGRFFDVKGVKGMRKFVKEIAIAAATGQHENELIGIAKVPLSTIPASGMTMWYSLDKKNKITRQGVIKIRIAFSSEKNHQVAKQEHRHLMKIILLHELEMSKVAPYWWCGGYSAQGEALLTQHIAQSGLSPIEVALCQWTVYTSIHQNHALHFNLFVKILDKCHKAVKECQISDDEVRFFWEGVKKLLPSCFSIIRKLRKKDFKDRMTLQQLDNILTVMKYLTDLNYTGYDLFPKQSYSWLNYDDTERYTLIGVLDQAVKKGADDWFNHIIDNNKKTECGKLQFLIQAIQLVRSDLQKAIEFYDKYFQKTVNYRYANALYIFYQAKLAELTEPEVRDICQNLKKLKNFTGFTTCQTDAEESLKEGTTLFELYLSLHRFVILGQGLCQNDHEQFIIRNFYQWFHGGVAQWLDIAVFKALQRIEKAVELDNLIPVDNTVKYSSSAVDTLTIFYQVKVFWQQLNWPDVEGCYTFIAKIIDDICRCCVFYAERMSMRVDGMGVKSTIYETIFEVTNEWCLAINNIEYVRQSLEPFTNELGMEEVIEKLSDLTSSLEAKRCQDTLDNVIANAIDTVKNEIITLLETVVKKMAPSMKRLLIEGAELFNQDSNSIDRLMLYVDTNLTTLHNELNEENFNRILEIVWDQVGSILKEIIQQNLEKRRPPSFFANLHKTLNLMMGSFKNSQDYNCADLQKIEMKLKLNGLETCDLIHFVHLELYRKSKNLTDDELKHGELSVRAKFDSSTTLKIQIINARNLVAMDSNGNSDSFVRVHLLPEHRFNGVPKPKTATHYKTLFPLFDEDFVLNLPESYENIEDGLVLFSVKDKDMLGYNNQYIGEGFLHFDEIDKSDTPIESLDQVFLPLIRPTDLNSEAICALEHRAGDKLAKEFLRKFKQRMGT